MKTQKQRIAMGLTMVLALLGTEGCAGHENRVQGALEALDHGAPARAIQGLNAQLGVRRTEDLPALRKDNALLLLDRGTVLLSLGKHDRAARDMGLADKGLDVLDLSRTNKHDLGRYLFTDDAGPYRAPGHEKLLLNTLNMVNYLALGDLSGARVEARRLAVMQSYLDRRDATTKLVGVGSYLAGFTFEKSGRRDEALLFYEEALKSSSYDSLVEPLQSLTTDETKLPKIAALLEDADEEPAQDEANTGEIVVVVGYGRVAQKVPVRMPVGQALQLVGGLMSSEDRSQAESLAARGLVTWVNYPALGPKRRNYEKPVFLMDGQEQALEKPLDVDGEMRREWQEQQSTIVLAALTRLVARTAAGYAVQEGSSAAMVAGSSNQSNSSSSDQNLANGLGLLLGLATTATMSAVDTPDTRSWSTLPAKITVGRIRVPAGEHTVTLKARGQKRTQQVHVDAGGWAFVPMFVLR